jgi:hypothetical protein
MIIPAGFAQVNIRFSGAAVPRGAEVAFGVLPDGLDTPEEIGFAIKDAGDAAVIQDLISTECRIEDMLIKLGPNSTGLSGVVPYGVNGALSSGAGNPSSALLVRKATGVGGRHGRGRMFWPALPEAYILPGGSLDPALVTAAQDIVDAFLAKLVVDDCPMVLLHGDATTPTAVTGLVVDGRVANQRRRNRK